MHQKPKRNKISQRETTCWETSKRGNQMPPREERPTAPPPTNIHASPPGSHRPTATAPQTRAAAPSGLSRHTPGCYIQRPLTPLGEGLERQRSERVLGSSKMKEKKMFQEGGEAGVLQRSTPPGGFWQHTAPSWHDGKQKWSKLLLGVLKYNSVAWCPDKVAVFHFSDKFLHYNFFGADYRR